MQPGDIPRQALEELHRGCSERQVRLRKEEKTSATSREKKRLTLDLAPRCSLSEEPRQCKLASSRKRLGLALERFVYTNATACSREWFRIMRKTKVLA